ncbi:MAG: sensor domain-containing protein [Janthinobacterium lividum]
MRADVNLYRDAFESAPAGMFVCRADGTLIAVNRALALITGFSTEELLQQRNLLSLHEPNELSWRPDVPLSHERLGIPTPAFPASAPARHARGAYGALGRPDPALLYAAEWTWLRRDGAPIAVYLCLARTAGEGAQPDADGNHYVGTVTRMADLLADKPSLPFTSTQHDPVTRLPNQSLLRERMEHMISRCERSGRKFWLLVIEHDQLRVLQDSLGPAAIDVALRIAADRLRDATAFDDALACVGANQFVVVLADHAVPVGVAASRLIERLGEPIECLGTAVRLTASVGVATFPDDAREAPLLMQRAVIALNAARAQGGNAVRHFSGELQSQAARRLDLEVSLREALAREQFNLVYQPQVAIGTGEINSVEALLRWNHPLKGSIPPVEFIPIAEESGLILQIGAWVMHEACAQISRLLRLYGNAPRVAVNVSPLQFQRQDVYALVREALKAAALEPRYLEVEITEGVLMGNTEQAIATLRSLRELGVHVAIDDFGTGYSSFAYLSRFKVDRLKIDRSFVSAITTDRDGGAIVAAIIAMAHALEIRVTAEGVETAAQAQKLTELQCDDAQGYWYSRPLAKPALENLFAPLS